MLMFFVHEDLHIIEAIQLIHIHSMYLTSQMALLHVDKIVKHNLPTGLFVCPE